MKNQVLNLATSCFSLVSVTLLIIHSVGTLQPASGVGRGLVDSTPVSLSSNFKSNPWSVVLFYSPSCTHCKNLMPALTQANQELFETSHREMFRVDCQNYPELIVHYNITYFPWLSCFKHFEYLAELDTNSKLTPQSILSWVRNCESGQFKIENKGTNFKKTSIRKLPKSVVPPSHTSKVSRKLSTPSKYAKAGSTPLI